MNHFEQTTFLDMIADGIDAMNDARGDIARAAVKFATAIPHVCDPGWKLDRTIPGPVPDRQHTEVWTLNVVCAMPDGTDPAHVRAAGAVCQSLRVEITTLRTLTPMVRYNDDVSILDGAGNVAGVTTFRSLPESIQLDLVDAIKGNREKAKRAEGEIIGREGGSKVPNDNEFKPRAVNEAKWGLTSEYVCAHWNRGVSVAKCDNRFGDTHYYVFDVASGEATARVGSKTAAFERARDQGSVTNG